VSQSIESRESYARLRETKFPDYIQQQASAFKSHRDTELVFGYLCLAVEDGELAFSNALSQLAHCVGFYENVLLCYWLGRV
jgi:hypothetical protein